MVGPPWVFVGLRYFEKVIPAINSLLCRLHDLVNIMGYICKLHRWGPRMSSNMADFLLFFTFFSLTLVFLDKIKRFTHSYSFKQLNM